MSTSNTVMYAAPGLPIVTLYGCAPTPTADPPSGHPWPLPVDPAPLPTPEEMKQICLQDALIADLLKRITVLEARVLELEKGA